jgi:hypothetical protein
VAFIDLDALIEQLKTDARIQLRMMTVPRPIRGLVGPVGAFSIRYEMMPGGIGVEGGGVNASFDLTGWEIVPEQDLRGESIETAVAPASDFLRAINRLDPARDAVTLWVYPDGFELYRPLRDALHERGFLVSARPLPETMPIRGSPSGSLSAGQ